MTGQPLSIAYATVLSSTFPVPGAMPCGEARAAEIAIVAGRCAVPDADWTALGPYRAKDGRLLFDCPGVARYQCNDATRVVVEPAPRADPRTVSEMLIATALPGLMWARGGIVLHAAAAVLPGADRAIAVTGPSGAGKSTLLNAFLIGGADCLADDSMCVVEQSGALSASGLPAGYFLGSDGDARFFCPVDPARQRASAPLGALLVIDPGDHERPEFHRLEGAERIAALLAARHRPKIPRILGREAANLAQLATIAQRVPIYAWRRARGRPEPDGMELDFLHSLGQTDI